MIIWYYKKLTWLTQKNLFSFQYEVSCCEKHVLYNNVSTECRKGILLLTSNNSKSLKEYLMDIYPMQVNAIHLLKVIGKVINKNK